MIGRCYCGFGFGFVRMTSQSEMDDAIAALDGLVIPIYIGFKGCFDIIPDQIIQPDVRIFLFLKRRKRKKNHNSKFCYLFSAQYHNNDAINNLIRLKPRCSRPHLIYYTCKILFC